jgi:hypothetical protein
MRDMAFSCCLVTGRGTRRPTSHIQISYATAAGLHAMVDYCCDLVASAESRGRHNLQSEMTKSTGKREEAVNSTTPAKASLRLVRGCTVTLFFAADMGAASAHGGGHSGGSHDSGGQYHNGNDGSDRGDHHVHYRHDHHHPDHNGVGPISGGNPPTYHQPVVKIPVSGVTTSHLPVKPCVGECAPVRLCNGLPCHRGGP